MSIVCAAMVLLAACSKEGVKVVLPDGSVSFDRAAGKDTVETALSILKDSTMVLKLNATLSAEPSSDDHWVTFAVDTTKILDYRAKYGNAVVLPRGAYLFHKPMTRIPAGGTVSEAAELNIAAQTKLMEYTTYVLPVVINAVDGKIEGTATSRVIYYVFKTGKPLFINKVGWAIFDYSSHFSNFVPANVIDNNTTTTYWASNITMQMPQWVTINFNRDVTFTGVTYAIPTALVYPTQGGYPTSIRIETSMNGTTWVNKGLFTGNIVNRTQALDMGLTTARYLRFTSVASIKYVNTYDAIFISDISLMP